MQNTPKLYSFSGLIAALGLLALLVGFVLMVLLPGLRLAAGNDFTHHRNML